MTDWHFVINRLILPFLLTVLLLAANHYKKDIERFLQLNKKKRWFNFSKFVFDGIKLRLDNPNKTILLAAISSVAVVMLIAIVFRIIPQSQSEPAIFAVLTSGFISPIAEEFLTRGLIIGMIAAIALFASLKYKKSKPIEYTILTIGVLLTSVVFTTSHLNYTSFQYVSRFSSSILYSVLYLANRRNLLPAIVAHSTWNILLITSDVVNFHLPLF